MFSVTMKEIRDKFSLECMCCQELLEKLTITSSDINRPGLQLVGYMEFFGNDRIQIMGKGEIAYLEALPARERYNRLDSFFSQGFPCIVVTRGLDMPEELKEVSEKYKIPLFRTKEITSHFMSELILYLNLQLAPRTSKHAVLVEVYGEGILILGESGVGKSEIALELVKRGHRLVADDLVEIRKVSDKTLTGTAPDMIRHLIEIRGIGILDVKNLFGVGSVKLIENIHLVMHMERWDEKKVYERVGLVTEYTDILGIKVPSHTIPVSPGRNLAIIVEVAAMNNRQKKMGYNTAEVLNERVIGEATRESMENSQKEQQTI